MSFSMSKIWLFIAYFLRNQIFQKEENSSNKNFKTQVQVPHHSFYESIWVNKCCFISIFQLLWIALTDSQMLNTGFSTKIHNITGFSLYYFLNSSVPAQLHPFSLFLTVHVYTPRIHSLCSWLCMSILHASILSVLDSACLYSMHPFSLLLKFHGMLLCFSLNISADVVGIWNCQQINSVFCQLLLSECLSQCQKGSWMEQNRKQSPWGWNEGLRETFTSPTPVTYFWG